VSTLHHLRLGQQASGARLVCIAVVRIMHNWSRRERWAVPATTKRCPNTRLPCGFEPSRRRLSFAEEIRCDLCSNMHAWGGESDVGKGLHDSRRASAAVSCVSFRRSLLAKLAAGRRFSVSSHDDGQWHPGNSRGSRSPAERTIPQPSMRACSLRQITRGNRHKNSKALVWGR
jgi:hypothetical protein